MQVLGSSRSAVVLLGWGHGHRVLVRSTILLSPGAPRPLAEALKTKAKFPVGFWLTVVEDQVVTHICFIFLLATPSGEGAASPPRLSRPRLPPFALRARRAQPHGRTLPADPFGDPPRSGTTPTAKPSISWCGDSCLRPPRAADAHAASQQPGKYIHEGVKKKIK